MNILCCYMFGIETVSAAAGVPLAVIITVPTILLVLIVIATSIIVITVIKIRKKEVEEYYSEVGPPPLPMRIERNTSHQQGLQTFPVLNVGDHGQNIAAHIATALVDENSLKTKQVTTTPENPANVANELYTVTTTENTAYQANELDVTLTENTAYGATEVTVTTSENLAYGATEVTVTTSENLAYGATEVTVTTSENPAYITNFTDLSNGNDTET